MLNGEDILEPKVNKGTLDLEDELKDHFLYQDIYKAILDYNSVYKKMILRESKGLTLNAGSETGSFSIQGSAATDRPMEAQIGQNGELVITLPNSAAKEDNPDTKPRTVVDEATQRLVINLPTKQQIEQKLSSTQWQPMEQARQDLVYEFQVLMGRIVADSLTQAELKQAGRSLNLPGSKFVFREF